MSSIWHKGGSWVRRAVTWVFASPLLGGYAYLVAPSRVPASRGSAVTWWSLLTVSLAGGLLCVGVWSLANLLFNTTSAIPALLASAAMLLGPTRQPLTSLARLTSRQAESRSLTLAVLAVGLVVLIQEIRVPVPCTEGWLWAGLAWVRPFEQHYRVLILAPLWGAWAMIVTPKFCRPGDHTDPATRTLANSCGPVLSAALLTVPLGLTVFYFQWMGWWTFIPAGTALAAALLAPAGCRRLGGGLGRSGLLAANGLTQIAFLLAYLVGRYGWTGFGAW